MKTLYDEVHGKHREKTKREPSLRAVEAKLEIGDPASTYHLRDGSRQRPINQCSHRALVEWYDTLTMVLREGEKRMGADWVHLASTRLPVIRAELRRRDVDEELRA
jgi:hypothetical protein